MNGNVSVLQNKGNVTRYEANHTHLHVSDDLDAIEAYIAQDSPKEGADMWLHIDDQVAALAGPNFPRRPGRVAGTSELVAHKNYIVILEEDVTTVTILTVVNARKKYP